MDVETDNLIKEALQQTGALNDTDALKKTYLLLGNKQTKLQQLLDAAEKICKTYFTENNLEHLVIGTAAVK